MRTSRMGCALVLLALATPAFAQDPQQERKATERGIAYLLGCQLQDGSWRNELGESQDPGMRVAITALCMDGLLRWSQEEKVAKAAQRGLAFIRKNVGALAGSFDVNPQFNFNFWGTALGMSHLHEALMHWPGQKPDVKKTVAAMIERAAKTQVPCGGWSYIKQDRQGNPWQDGSVSFLTAAMAEGLLRWKKSGMKLEGTMLNRALLDLEKSLERSGKLPYQHSGNYASLAGGDSAGRTVQVTLLLAEAERSSNDVLRKAVDTFFKERETYEKLRKTRPHTPPTMISGYYYYFVHHYVARAMRRLGSDPKKYAQVLRNAFLKEQESDGSWFATVSCGRTVGTAYVLMALDDLRSMTWRGSYEEALRVAQATKKPLLVVLSDGKKASRKALKNLEDPALADMLGKFVCVRVPVEKKDPVCKALRVSTGRAFFVLDSRAENPLKTVLEKRRAIPSAKTLLKVLSTALEKWNK